MTEKQYTELFSALRILQDRVHNLEVEIKQLHTKHEENGFRIQSLRRKLEDLGGEQQ